MKYHLVTWDHFTTVGFTNQKDALTLVSLLSKGLQMKRDLDSYPEEVWLKGPIGEVSLRTIFLADMTEARAALQKADRLPPPLRKALPAPAPHLQLGYSNEP